MSLAAKLPKPPEFTAALGIEYGFRAGPGRLSLSADYSHKSSFYFQATNAPGDGRAPVG